MNAAELKACRESLGLPAAWLADHLGVALRSVQRWEDGQRAVPDGVADALAMLEAEQTEHVERHVEAMHGHPDPVLLIEPGDDMWPERWQRAVAWRVRQQVPTVRIVQRS